MQGGMDAGTKGSRDAAHADWSNSKYLGEVMQVVTAIKEFHDTALVLLTVTFQPGSTSKSAAVGLSNTVRLSTAYAMVCDRFCDPGGEKERSSVAHGPPHAVESV